jgi:hypothetical protein
MSSSDSESDNEDAPIVPVVIAAVNEQVVVPHVRVRKRHHYSFTKKAKILMVQEAYGIPKNVNITADSLASIILALLVGKINFYN